MAYLKYIVEFINAQLNEGLLSNEKYRNKKIIAIAQSMPRRESDKNLELFPSFVDEDGEGQYIGPDDEFDFIGYHRVNTIGVGKAVLNKGFGDGKGYDANSIKMSYVVFAQRDRLKLTNDELALYIQVHFPEALEKALMEKCQLKVCNINITDIILNDLQVFNEEFQGIEFFLKPEQYLLKVNYTIESAFSKKCFTTCC
jgi:hypothetical protein